MYLSSPASFMLQLLLAVAKAKTKPINVDRLSKATGKGRSSVEVYIGQARRSGLCTSTMGPTGGYQLAKPANKIDLHTITKQADIASRIKSINHEKVWCPVRVKKEIGDTLSDITLADLLS